MGAYLPMALGAGDTTLLRMTMAYAMLANGAREITPTLIDRVQDRNGKTIYRHEPRELHRLRRQPPATARSRRRREIVDHAQAVPRSGQRLPGRQHDAGRDHARHGGPARRALGRPIAGKTGTTNDQRDNWFIGRTPDLTIGIYVGFDEPRSLGIRRQAAAPRRRSSSASPARSSRTSRRCRSAFRPACAWSGSTTTPASRPMRATPGDRRGLQARHRARIAKVHRHPLTDQPLLPV